MADTIIKRAEFSQLRAAYITVKEFIRAESLDDVDIRLDTRIYADLSISGDDNYEMLTKFVERFSLDYSKFRYGEHFYSEGELYSSEAVGLKLLEFLIWIPKKLTHIVTRGRFTAPPFLRFEPARKVLDLSFREMLVWYLESKYEPDSNLRYEIA